MWPANQKIVSKLSEIWSGLFIPDPDPDFYPSRIPDPGVKKVPDPQHWNIWLINTEVATFNCTWVSPWCRRCGSCFDRCRNPPRTQTETHPPIRTFPANCTSMFRKERETKTKMYEQPFPCNDLPLFFWVLLTNGVCMYKKIYTSVPGYHTFFSPASL